MFFVFNGIQNEHWAAVHVLSVHEVLAEYNIAAVRDHLLPIKDR